MTGAIAFNMGTGYPSSTTGPRISLYPGGANPDVAIGVASNVFWFGLPTNGYDFRWYAGTFMAMQLPGQGYLNLFNSASGTTPNVPSGQSQWGINVVSDARGLTAI
jgi:hypothetical protein